MTLPTGPRTEVLVAGASLGGVLAAWQAARAGRRVLLLAEHPWLGGQMTAQAVPPDEHRFIERPGSASASYLGFRADMRSLYRARPGFADRSVMTPGLTNPGDGWVSRLCIEPALAAAWFERLLGAEVTAGRLRIRRGAVLGAVWRDGRRLVALEARAPGDGLRERIEADVFVDATDTGELLHRAGLPSRLGKEARSEFDEPDAPAVADRLDQQPVTHVFALRDTGRPGTAAPRPARYDRWRETIVRGHAHRLFSESMPAREPGGSARLPLRAADGHGQPPTLDWWRYRRVVAAHQWPESGNDEHRDASLVNWAQNDHAAAPLLEGALSPEAVAASARELSACFLHWLHTEAPRPDGGTGWPEWQPAAGLLGTADGFAQQLYVRESRRIVGLHALTQRALLAPPERRADSLGIAWYPMDLHPTCNSGHTANAAVWPFELPAGLWVPQEVENLLPGCKNIATTQLAGACTRVHPAEWLVGEVAGLMAATLCEQRIATQALLEPRRLAALKARLSAAGIPQHWPDAWLAEAAPGADAH